MTFAALDLQPLPDIESSPPSQEKIAPDRQLATTFDYFDADGGLIYRIVAADNGKRGVQRPVPAMAGVWAWGLKGGQFVRRWDGGDFFPANDERTPSQGWTVQITIDDDIAHSLYNFSELREEMIQAEDERRIVWLCKNELDCQALAEWGLLPTTNSNGLRNWQPHLSEYLRGADVVIIVDNDKLSRDRAELLAKSLFGVTKRTRLVYLIEWGDTLAKAMAGALTRDRLYSVVERLASWSPAPFKSNFGAIRWSELGLKRPDYEWLIEGLLPANDRALIYGEPESGKSFAAADMSLSIARGVPYEGLPVRRGGVVYCAFEGGKGFANRIDGYRRWHDLNVADSVSFVMLTKNADFFASEDIRKALRLEIEGFAEEFKRNGVDLALVVFDTVSASCNGMEENDGKDVSKYLAYGRELMGGLSCTLLYIHHVPKGGTTPRGSGKWTGDLETTIVVRADRHNMCDENGRPVRVVRLEKQREGEGHRDVKRFVLRQTEIGKNGYGRPITTCVLLPPGGDTAGPSQKGFFPTTQETKVLRALLDAIKKVGTPPPPEANLASTVDRVITYQQWRDAYEAIDIGGDEEDTKRRNRIKQAMKRSGETLMAKFKIIGKHEFDAQHKIFWWTGKPVRGFPETWPQNRLREEQPIVEGEETLTDF